MSRETAISYPLIDRRTCAYQGVRHVRFSEHLEYVLNGWPLRLMSMIETFYLFYIFWLQSDLIGSYKDKTQAIFLPKVALIKINK